MKGEMYHMEDSESEEFIDDVNYFQTIKKVESSDPFKKVKYTSLSSRMKRMATRLAKKYDGVEGVGTKYIDPEELDGYSLYDVVTPPYDLETLADLYDSSAIHNAAINARAMNTVGLGYTFPETLKSKRRLEKANGNPERMARVRKAIQDTRQDLETKFENFNEEETFIETMTRVWLDVLTTGNGYLEIGRNNSGEIGYIGH